MGKGMNGINITCYEKNVVNYSKKCEFKFRKILIVGHGHQQYPLLVVYCILTGRCHASLPHVSGNHACAELSLF